MLSINIIEIIVIIDCNMFSVEKKCSVFIAHLSRSHKRSRTHYHLFVLLEMFFIDLMLLLISDYHIWTTRIKASGYKA